MSKYFIFYALVVQYFLVSNCKQFGYLELFTCHCKYDVNCNYNGFCATGCATGWIGSTCQKQNVAFGKPADQSTEMFGRGPELAVDGDRTTNPDKCMDTGYSNNRWWSVNLTDTYPIKQIHILYRPSYLYSLKGFEIDVIQDNGTQVECYKQPDDVEPSMTDFVVSCNNVIWGSGINISSTSGPNHFFVFCEVEVYGLCSNRTFGENCENVCYCKDNVQCNYITGECQTEECLPGFTGSSCNQLCSNRTYGENCENVCYCKDNVQCNYITGECPTEECLPGFAGSSCNQQCQTGTYGKNCYNPCPTNCLNGDCHHVNGSCIRGCKPGFTAEFCYQGPGGENDSTMIIVVLGSIVSILLVVMIVGFVYFKKRISSKPPDIIDSPVEYDVITSSTNAVNARVSESTPTTTPNTDSQQHRTKPDRPIGDEATLPEDHAYVNEIADYVSPMQSRCIYYDSLGTAYMNENPYEHISN